jgi:aspartyl protease family protein
MLGWLTLVFAALAGLFALLRHDPSAFSRLTADQTIYLAIGAGLLVFYALTSGAGRGGRLASAMRHLSIWAVLMVGLVTGYTYRDELSAVAYRVAGELLPPGQTVAVETGEAGEKSVRIRRRADGHFIARTEINGFRADMLVDTGASTVVLKPADAERMGLDTRNLSFTVPVQTANGTTYAASVRLRTIAVGPIRVRDVEALVAKPGTLKDSLLGISFLRRLRSYEFSGDFLTLRS